MSWRTKGLSESEVSTVCWVRGHLVCTGDSFIPAHPAPPSSKGFLLRPHWALAGLRWLLSSPKPKPMGCELKSWLPSPQVCGRGVNGPGVTAGVAMLGRSRERWSNSPWVEGELLTPPGDGKLLLPLKCSEGCWGVSELLWAIV